MPAEFVAVAVIVYVRPLPLPRRSARSCTTRGCTPDPPMTTSPDASGSFDVTATVSDARLPADTDAAIVATVTSLPFGGQIEQLTGMPVMTGGAVMTLIDTIFDAV